MKNRPLHAISADCTDKSRVTLCVYLPSPLFSFLSLVDPAVRTNQGGAEDEEPAVLHGPPAGGSGAEAGGLVVRRGLLLPPPGQERAGPALLPQGETKLEIKERVGGPQNFGTGGVRKFSLLSPLRQERAGPALLSQRCRVR